MKRQLDDTEKELTNKGMFRLTIDVVELTESLEYNKDLKEKEKYLREFDDRWRTTLRTRKDEADEKTLKQISDMITEKNNTIKEMERQLKEGVESPAGVI